MANLKTYLRNFSKTLGILRPFDESIEHNLTQANNDLIAPFDGYMQVSVSCTRCWINVTIQGRESPVLSLQTSAYKTELSSTIPIKKGSSYHIDTDWTDGRYNVTLFPLMNSN